MLFSSFAGLLLFTVPGAGQSLSPTENANGDRFIGTDYEESTWNIQGLQNLNGNLTIGAGGTVIVQNGDLNFLSYKTATVDRVHHLTIEDGGKLILINSNLTTGNTLYGAFNALGVLIRNNGSLSAENSRLEFQGKMLIDNATFIAKSSQVNGPLVTAISSDIQLYDSSITDIPGTPTSLGEVYAYPFATSYNNTANVDYTVERNPDPLRTVVPDGDAINLTTSGSGYAAIGNLESMTISGFDIGGLVFNEGEAMNVRLMAEYRTSDLFVAGGVPDTFWYYEYLDPTPDQASNMQVFQTYEPSEPALTNTEKVIYQDLTSLSLSSMDISLLTVTFNNGNAETVFIDRVWIEIVLTLPAYNNLYIAGDSELTAVDSMLGVNNMNYSLPEQRKLVVTDTAVANLYGVMIEDEYYKNGSTPFVTVRKDITFKPTAQGPSDNTTEGSVFDLLTNNNVYYTVPGLGTLHVTAFYTNGYTGMISDAKLVVDYTGSAPYASSAFVQWNVTGKPLQNTSIAIDANYPETLEYDLLQFNTVTLADFSNINIKFSNPDTNNTLFDVIWIVVKTDPTINIYRWVDVSVVGSDGLPVPGAIVNTTNSKGPASYYYNSTLNAEPSQGVLEYLERNSTNFNVTDDNGLVSLPLLTDVINEDWAPNAMAVGAYSVKVTYINETSVPISPAVQDTRFDAFPDLIPQRMSMKFVIDTIVTGGSDWVVTGSEIMSAPLFTWQKNIIVEGNGVLTIKGTSVTMSKNVDTITQVVVRDNGLLVLENVVLNADFENMKVYLFDNGRLFLNSTTLMPNVGLVMDDSSQVFMDEARIRGAMSAPSTSSVSLVAFNTTFDKAITEFGGNSVAVLTGASIAGTPPVSPKDNAVIHLYSWIVAEVFDGTGLHLLSGVKVEVRKFPSTLYFTGTTNENGTVTVQALSAIVSSKGPQLFGSYVLNATYWYGGDRYDSDKKPIASVLYVSTRNLVRDDAYVRMDLPDAKPDIDPPFYASNITPLRGSEVTLSTVINNIGIVTAYDILVRFSDVSSTGTVIIKNYTIDELAPQSNLTVNVTWTAAYPLGQHNLTVTVDPLNAIPELNEDNNVNYTLVEVLGVPDLAVVKEDVTIGSEAARGRTVMISAFIANLGDRTASNITVTFNDSVGGIIKNIPIGDIPTGLKREATMEWVPAEAGARTITVKVSMGGPIAEGDLSNNEAQITVTVADYPDLIAMDVSFMVNGVAKNEVNLNDDIKVVAAVYNDGESSAVNFKVVFWLDGVTMVGSVDVASLASKATTAVSMDWDPSTMPNIGQLNEITMLAEVNPDTDANYTHITELDDPLNPNNRATEDLLVRDNRPDLAVTDALVRSNNVNVTTGVLGEKIIVSFNVRNIGLVDATNVKVGVYLDGDVRTVLFEQTRNIAVGGAAQFSVPWTVNVTRDDYQLVINAGVGLDANQTDNQRVVVFTVAAMDPDITISLNKANYAPGDAILINGRITQGPQKAPIAGLAVTIVLTDATGFPLTASQSTTTDKDGYFYAVLQTPPEKEGSQVVRAYVNSVDGNFTGAASLNIIAPFTPQSIPSYVYLLIVAIVIAVIVIFSIYLYRVGLGRMVECGNCGALIPEVSKHCPKCGVEFERDTAKCSECGAWIPSQAESCPDCGAKFMTEPLEGEQSSGYIEAMRKQYDEYVDGFRTQAKTALGSKYSEDKFQEWLQTEPSYLPFEEWLRKEEMGRKSGVFPCPACGTLNPRDAKVCNRCGTVFEQAADGAANAKSEEKEKKGTFRRIVRRSGEEKPKAGPAKESPAPVEEASKPDEGGDKPQ